MTKILKTILAVCIALFTVSPVFSANSSDEKDPPKDWRPIILNPTDGLGNDHRSLSAPFDMYYQSGAIFTEFYDNIGFVSVTIVNTDTGEVWNATLDSSMMFSTVNVSTTDWEGSYDLVVVDGHNNTYSGHFVLN